jgi:hypothetical protein
MKREISAAEAVITFVFFAAWYAGLGLVHPTFPASILGCASLFLVEPLLVLAHELGHAAAAVHVTRRPARVQSGQPPHSWRFSIGRVQVDYSWRGYTGHCEFDRSVPITGWGLFLIAVAGPAANLVVAILLGCIAYLNPDAPSLVVWTLYLTAVASALLAVGNLIPQSDLPEWWPGGIESDHVISDGYIALLALKGGLRSTLLAPPPPRLFNGDARQALLAAGGFARAQRRPEVGPDHLLLGLFDVGDGAAARVLRECGFRPPPREFGGPPVDPVLTPAAKRAIERAKAVLSLRGDPQIATEHLLLGLVEERDGPAAAVLEHGGVDRERVRQRLLEALSP